jgi:hypothetical protein
LGRKRGPRDLALFFLSFMLRERLKLIGGVALVAWAAGLQVSEGG